MKNVNFWTISILDPQCSGHRSQEDGSNSIRQGTKGATIALNLFAFGTASQHAKYREIRNSERYDFSTVSDVLTCYVRDPTNLAADSCTVIKSASNEV